VTMRGWLRKLLASTGFGIFVAHEAHNVATDLHPHGFIRDPGIWSYVAPEPPSPPHPLDERLPVVPPPPPFPPELYVPATSQQGHVDAALIAHWAAQRNIHFRRAANIAAIAGAEPDSGFHRAEVPLVVNSAG